MGGGCWNCTWHGAGCSAREKAMAEESEVEDEDEGEQHGTYTPSDTSNDGESDLWQSDVEEQSVAATS